jgi:hypothetical protein
MIRLSRKTFSTLDSVIIAALLELQLGRCVSCNADLEQTGYQLTHKRYGEDIGLRDLDLKCGPCHARDHGHKKATGTMRRRVAK